MRKPTTTEVGKGAWRISYYEDGSICAVELWKDGEDGTKGQTYEVLDVKSRMRPT